MGYNWSNLACAFVIKLGNLNTTLVKHTGLADRIILKSKGMKIKMLDTDDLGRGWRGRDLRPGRSMGIGSIISKVASLGLQMLYKLREKDEGEKNQERVVVFHSSLLLIKGKKNQ